MNSTCTSACVGKSLNSLLSVIQTFEGCFMYSSDKLEFTCKRNTLCKGSMHFYETVRKTKDLHSFLLLVVSGKHILHQAIFLWSEMKIDFKPRFL